MFLDLERLCKAVFFIFRSSDNRSAMAVLLSLDPERSIATAKCELKLSLDPERL